MTDALQALRDRLEPEQLDHLTQAIADARTTQAEALAQAMEDGLDIVPKMLRGTVRKVLFG